MASNNDLGSKGEAIAKAFLEKNNRKWPVKKVQPRSWPTKI